MRPEFKSSQYDAIYAAGGRDGIYDLHYRHNGYYPLFRAVQSCLKDSGKRSVLEVGCGTGAFAHMLHERGGIRYRGFDFSAAAVTRAVARFSYPELFFVADARETASYAGNFEAIVCTEVLEHIDSDLDAVRCWPAGTYCIVSVPNFDADNHVRHFRSEQEVHDRYGSLVDIDRIVRVKKPVLNDISAAHLWRALRWNRYRPRRLLELFGLARFEEVGGWYVFTGKRRA